ncbi:DNA lyase [Candidatus Pacearchaeota archaeon]|nr:DNA lyase [Candidatus Pacearchaeota archaeon]
MRDILKKEYRENKEKIIKRLEEFKDLPRKEYIYEYIFCLLTPQSNAKKCWQAVEEIKKLDKIDKDLIISIIRTKTRFHNNKSKFIIEALKNWINVEKRLIDERDIIKLRNWLAENVMGYGLKEASHFLRNIGKSENKIAILDRHILKNLMDLDVINEDKIRNKNNYFNFEQRFISFSSEIGIPLDHLDLLFWSKENGEIFK